MSEILYISTYTLNNNIFNIRNCNYYLKFNNILQRNYFIEKINNQNNNKYIIQYYQNIPYIIIKPNDFINIMLIYYRNEY